MPVNAASGGVDVHGGEITSKQWMRLRDELRSSMRLPAEQPRAGVKTSLSSLSGDLRRSGCERRFRQPIDHGDSGQHQECRHLRKSEERHETCPMDESHSTFYALE